MDPFEDRHCSELDSIYVLHSQDGHDEITPNDDASEQPGGERSKAVGERATSPDHDCC